MPKGEDIMGRPIRGGSEEKISDSGLKNGRKPLLRKLKTDARMTCEEIKHAAIEAKEGSYFETQMVNIVTKGAIKSGYTRDGMHYRASVFETPEAQVILIGGFMELTNEELKMVNGQVTESKKILQSLYNEVRTVHDQIQPELTKQIMEIRNARMAIVSEIQAMLTMLKDIRKFFLESDYEKEVGRLKEFIRVCEELEGLKKRGVLDAIGDTVIKLSLKESEVSGG